jgi:hypothetical protein
MAYLVQYDRRDKHQQEDERVAAEQVVTEPEDNYANRYRCYDRVGG